MKKLAINGFGRIGRLTLRQLLKSDEVEVVAINDLTDSKILAHLLKHDSTHGELDATVEASPEGISINGKLIRVFAEKDPAYLPWASLKIDLVLECTGLFRTEDKMSLHITAGAKKVLLSAPGKGDIKTVVLGVNEETLSPEDVLISNASCTTNCLAPMAKVLDDNFGIVKGFMTTIHSYTGDQNLLDGPHRDLRRARAAAINIVPTTTGAAKAVGLVLPHLDGKLDGMAVRVPTPTGSLTDLSVELKTPATKEEINAAMKKAAENEMKGYLKYSTQPLVSTDIVSDLSSCIFDSELTSASGNLVKVVGWYDNEYGYSARLADLAHIVSHL